MNKKLPTSYMTSTHIGIGTRVAATSGIAGAIIGGAVSAAKNMKDVKENKISKDQAIKNTMKDAAGTGIATAAGMIAAGALGLGALGSLVVLAGATTGAKYLWDSSTGSAPKKELPKA